MTKDSSGTDNQRLLSQPHYSNEAYQTQVNYSYGANQQSNNKNLAAPPAYSNANSIQPSPANPFYYSQQESSVARDVVHLQIPKGLECEIDSSALLKSPINHYTPQTYRSDNAKISRCLDYLSAIAGPLGLAVAVGIPLTMILLKADSAAVGGAAFCGTMLMIAYVMAFIKTMLCACCCSSNSQMRDKGAVAAYARATFQRQTSDLESVQASITQRQNDVPQLLVTVICCKSRLEDYLEMDGAKFDDSNKVEFKATYSLPIAHYRFLGPTTHQFLSTIDDIHSGDSLIEFLPEIVTFPGQEDYLQQFFSTVYETHKDKSKRCYVYARFVCGQYDARGNWYQPSLVEEIPIEYEPNVNRKKQKGEELIENIAVTTALGIRTEFYQSNGQSAGCFMRCMTSPSMWAVSSFTCLFGFVLPFLQCRWKQITYHSTFQVIFPKIEQILLEFRLNSENFLAHPPHILNSSSTKGV